MKIVELIMVDLLSTREVQHIDTEVSVDKIRTELKEISEYTKNSHYNSFRIFRNLAFVFIGIISIVLLLIIGYHFLFEKSIEFKLFNCVFLFLVITNIYISLFTIKYLRDK